MRRTTTIGISVLFLLLLPILAFGQDIIIDPIEPVDPIVVEPVIFVTDDDGELRKLTVGRVEVETLIVGSVAETSMTISFGNPFNRVMEGNLYFPLPSGATVSGYALDIQGVLVDGVVVDRDEGRQVFEEIVRRGVDPGLVEWTQGNVFQTRVFPIPARGSRTIRLRYVSDLNRRGDDLFYRLPMNFPDEVPQFSIRVEVVESESRPEVAAGGYSNFQFRTWRDSYVAETSLRDADLSEDLVVTLPDAELVQAAVESTGDDDYFLVRLEHPGALESAASGAAAKPDEVTLYWDASRSRRGQNNQTLINLVADYLATLGSGSVRLVAFRDTAEFVGEYRVRSGEAPELVAALEGLAYDGGTQPGTLPMPPRSTDMVMVVSDGIATFGERAFADFTKPVFVIAPGGRYNEPALAALAARSGGAYFNLDRLPAAEIVRRIGQAAPAVVEVVARSGRIEGVAVRNTGEAFTVSGRLETATARLNIDIADASGDVRTETVTLRRSDAREGDLLAGYWAQSRLNELLADEVANASEIRTLGREFGLVTPGTSLIVLESIDQYVEFRIPPPESLPEMRREYFAQIAELDRIKEDEKDDRLEMVLADWRRRIEWYEAEHRGEFVDPNVPEDGEFFGGGEMDEPSMVAPTDDRMRDAEDFGGTSGAGEMSPSMASGADTDDGPMEQRGEPGGDDSNPSGPVTELVPWNPDTPYLRELRSAPEDERYGVYLELSDEWASSPSFFVDSGDFFLDEGNSALAIRIWSNLAEIELENPQLLRVLAHRLDQAEELVLAESVFRRVLVMRPEEPQSYRDLALVLGRLDEYTEAIELLWEVAIGEWDGRFPEITNTALMEMNSFIPKAEAAGLRIPEIDERFVRLLDTDLRVVLTWDADLTDMDLWVTSPSGERIYYGNSRGSFGEYLSRDYVRGYGPEEYFVREAQKGSYFVQANYFGSGAVTLVGSVTLQVEIFTDYGRPEEKRQAVTVRLRGAGDVVDIGRVSF